MRRPRRALLAGCLIAMMTAGAPAAGSRPGPAAQGRGASATPVAGNPLLTLLQSEMNRNLDVLKKQDVPPYFIGYAVTEVRSTAILAQLGAILRSSENAERVLTTEVRVGNYDLDNTHTLRGGGPASLSSRVSIVALPLTDDELPIRAVVWRATDRRYKDAVSALTRVRTNVATKVKEESAADDFSREQPSVSIGTPATYAVDKAAWEQRLRRLTAAFTEDPAIYLGQARLSVASENRYYVNTEGTRLLTGRASWSVSLQAITKAADGMELPVYRSYQAASPGGLPAEAQMLADVRKMMKQAAALRTAPIVEPYAGPAILSGRAAGVFFHEIFGHRIEGHRQKNVDESQTFAKRVGQPVLPAFLSVIFDPTLAKFGGEDLNGYYQYDDQGVKAQRVTVVDKGVLKTFLMSRSPIPGFASSNGHGRAQTGLAPVSRQSNLMVESTQVVPYAQLLEKLKTELKAQGKPFGLLFDDIQGGMTMTGRSAPNAFTVVPLVVYRVYTDNRPPELVRGVDLIGTPLAAFGKIVATSDKPEVFNGTCGAESGSVPVSAVSPALLVSEVEVQKKAHSQETTPILPPPDKKKPS